MTSVYSIPKSEVPDYAPYISLDDINHAFSPSGNVAQNLRLALIVLTKDKDELYKAVEGGPGICLSILAAILSSLDNVNKVQKSLEVAKYRLLVTLYESLDEVTFRRVVELSEAGDCFDELIALSGHLGGES